MADQAYDEAANNGKLQSIHDIGFHREGGPRGVHNWEP